MPLICRVELNKHEGIIVTVDNEDGQTLQTIHMDGTSITTKVEGPADTSTIVQDQSSVTITCRNFTVDAETVKVNSSANSTHDCKGNFAIKSVGNITVDGKANINTTAVGALIDKGMTTTTEATAVATVKAAAINAQGQAAVSVKAPAVDVSAAAVLNAKGALVNVQASGPLALKGAASTVEGAVVRLAGVIKLG